MQNQPQAIFFDFDGVIVDSTQVKTEAFRTLFCEYDDQIVDQVVQYHQLHGGISRVEKIVLAHETFIKKPLSEKEVAIWAQKYAELVVEKVVVSPWIQGAKEFLETWLEKQPVFVISGTPEEELKRIIERREMTQYFDEILGSPLRKVPHIQMLLEKYNVHPEQCVFVGDAMTDYDAAKATGLHFVGIRSEIGFPPGTIVLPNCTGLEQAIVDLFE